MTIEGLATVIPGQGLRLTRLRKPVLALIVKWLVLPLATSLMGAMVIGRIVNAVLGTNTYKIYLVGSLDDEATRQIKAGFLNGGNGGLTLNGAAIQFEALNDLGEPSNAQRIAADLAARDNTLLVVGHISSTQTKQALPAYLQKARPPIPVILTTETNPHLLPPKISDEIYYPVFRLSPTDDAQAESAVRFAVAQGAQAFWVVEDTANPVYSGFLAREFVVRAEQQRRRVVLVTTNEHIPPLEVLQKLGVDWVFFAGDWHNGLVLVRQLRALRLGTQVILSDGCTDQRILEAGAQDVEGVYLTHPLTAKAYADSGFTRYGADARKLVEQLLESANRRFSDLAAARGGFPYLVRRVLGIRRVGDARNALVASMAAAVRVQRKFDLSAANGQIQFRDDGSPVATAFHVWKIQSGSFTDYPQGR